MSDDGTDKSENVKALDSASRKLDTNKVVGIVAVVVSVLAMVASIIQNKPKVFLESIPDWLELFFKFAVPFVYGILIVVGAIGLSVFVRRRHLALGIWRTAGKAFGILTAVSFASGRRSLRKPGIIAIFAAIAVMTVVGFASWNEFSRDIRAKIEAAQAEIQDYPVEPAQIDSAINEVEARFAAETRERAIIAAIQSARDKIESASGAAQSRLDEKKGSARVQIDGLAKRRANQAEADIRGASDSIYKMIVQFIDATRANMKVAGLSAANAAKSQVLNQAKSKFAKAGPNNIDRLRRQFVEAMKRETEQATRAAIEAVSREIVDARKLDIQVAAENAGQTTVEMALREIEDTGSQALKTLPPSTQPPSTQLPNALPPSALFPSTPSPNPPFIPTPQPGPPKPSIVAKPPKDPAQPKIRTGRQGIDRGSDVPQPRFPTPAVSCNQQGCREAGGYIGQGTLVGRKAYGLPD